MQKTPESVFDTDLSAIAVCDIERKDKIFQNKDQGGLQINDTEAEEVDMKIAIKREVIKLLADVTYTHVPYWFNLTMMDLKMDILMPKESKSHEKQPLIVWCCGGGFTVMDCHIWIPELVEYARRGYVVASIQYRTESQGEFPACLVDAKSAVRYLRAHAEEYCIDSENITIMGESAGGCLSCMVGVTNGEAAYEQGEYCGYSSKVNRVVSFYGPIFDGEQGVEMPKNQSLYSNMVNHDSTPQLLLQGDLDTLVDKSLMDHYKKKLDELGIPNQYVVVEGAGHGTEQFYQEEMVDIVDHFIKNT